MNDGINNNADIDAALSEMQNGTDANAANTDALSEMAKSNEGSSSEIAMAQPSVNPAQLGNVITEVENLMGDFFASLKPIDEAFARYADTFRENARQLMEKKELTDDEKAEVIANVGISICIQGFGNLVNTIKIQKQLLQVKNILKAEANKKLDRVNHIADKSMPDVVDAVCDRFYNMLQDGSTFEKCTETLNVCRSTLYTFDLVKYLQATYTAALDNSFQDWIPYPTMMDVNQRLLYKGLTQTEDAVADDKIIGNRRNSIDSLINGVHESIVGNTTPTASEYLFASDDQLMATAIHDYYPAPEKYEDAVMIDDDMNTESSTIYAKFDDLYGAAYDNPDSILSSYITGNEALLETEQHFLQMQNFTAEYGKRLTLYAINALLMGVAATVGMFAKFDLAWYWNLVVGAIVLLISYKLIPAQSLKDRYSLRLTYVERTIQFINRKMAGYSEHISLAKMQKNANKTWLWALLGAVAGFCFIPFPGGLLIGALIGFFIGKSSSDENVPDYDYTKLKKDLSWKAKTLMGILIALIVYGLAVIIWPDVFTGENSSEAATETTVQNETVAEEAVEVVAETVVPDAAGETQTAAEEAVTVETVANQSDDVVKFHLVGTIGKYPIDMHLEEITTGGLPAYKGRYKYTRTGNSFTLKGFSKGTEIELKETSSEGYCTGIFTLTWDEATLNGTFVNLSNGEEFPVTLDIEPEPGQ